MTIFKTLFKMMYNGSNYFGRGIGRRNRKSKSEKNSTFKSSIFFFLIFTLVAFISNAGVLMPDDVGLTQEAKEILFIRTTAQLLIMITLIFSVMTVVVGFFSNNDDTSYLPFPVKPMMIFGARYSSSLAISLPAPLGVCFGSIISALFLFRPFPPFMVFNFLLFALGTILFCSSIFYLFGSLLSVTFKLKKRKGILIGILMTLLIALSIFVSIMMSINVKVFLDITAFITNSLLGRKIESLGASAIVFAVGLAFSGLVLLTAKYTYIKSILGGADGPGKKKKKVSSEAINLRIDASAKKRSMFTIFLKKEISTLLKSGAYLANLIIPMIAYSVVLLITTVIVISVTNIKDIDASSIAPFAPVVAALIHTFSSMMNYSSGVSYSKDRLDSLQTATFPIRQNTLLRAKLVPGFTLFLVNFLLVDLVVLLLLKATIASILLYTLALIIYSVGLCYAQSSIDLKLGAPSDSNEMMLVKNSKMVGFSILLSFLSFAILICLPILLPFWVDIDPLLCILIALALATAFAVFFVIDAERNIDKRFHRFISNASN